MAFLKKTRVSLACVWLMAVLACMAESAVDSVFGQEARTHARHSAVLQAAPEPAAERGSRQLAPSPESRPAEKARTKLYRLEYADGRTLLHTIDEVLSQCPGKRTLSFDDRTNTIVASATEAAHTELAALIEQMDVPVARQDERQTRVFRLEHADPNDIANLLSNLLDDGPGRVAVDERTKSVILSAPAEAIDVMEDLLHDLDALKPPEPDGPQPPPSTAQVRIVWLLDGEHGEDAPAPPEDLNEVIGELSRAGVKGLQMFGQIVVNTDPGNRFQVSGFPALGGITSAWQISGTLDYQQGTPQLSIELMAPMTHQGANQRIMVETVVSAPYGHYVVLGVTPTGNFNSVFVVQVSAGKQSPGPQPATEPAHVSAQTPKTSP
ncbi:MAG: hypothetical protein JXB62_11715 [Pirellulales bacterium]|nr:hypothetical protein [Pirellulales bacterium]